MGCCRHHEVSDLGRARRWVPSRKEYRHIKLFNVGSGYLGFRPHLEDNNIYMHRKVAEVFLGPKADTGLQVCHNNGVKTDNRVANLRYGTALENARDRIAHGTTHRDKRFLSDGAEARLWGVLSQADSLGLSNCSVARLTGVSTNTVARARKVGTLRAAVA